MSIKSNIRRGIVTTRAERSNVRGLDFGHAFDHRCCSRRWPLRHSQRMPLRRPSCSISRPSPLRLLPRRAAHDRGRHDGARPARRRAGRSLLPRLRGAAPRAARRRRPGRLAQRLERVRASATCRPGSTSASRPKPGCSSPPARRLRATTAAASGRSRMRASATTTTRASRSSKRGRSSRRGRRRRGATRCGRGEARGVVEAFDAWAPSIDDPDWGHAEALTALGRRGARARRGAHGARSHRASAAARAGLSRRRSTCGPRCRRAHGGARCSARSHRCVLRRAGIRYAP